MTPVVSETGATTELRTSLRILRVEVTEALLAILREPAALFFSVAMPVAFFTLFTTIWGDQPLGPTTVGTRMLATFGTFGVLGVVLFNPGVGVADDRERGWLRLQRVSATPLPVTLTAKCLATIPYSVGVLVSMTAVAAVTGTLEVDGTAWVRLVAVLVVGGLPFGLIGLSVGLLTTPNAATAILQAILIPSAVVSGLWFPLEQLPDAIQRVAPVLPPYHLAQAGLSQIEGGSILVHLGVLAATSVGAAMMAALAYRRARP